MKKKDCAMMHYYVQIVFEKKSKKTHDNDLLKY